MLCTSPLPVTTESPPLSCQLKNDCYYFTCLGILPACMICVPHALGQKMASDPLELKFQTIVSYYVGSGNPGPLQEQQMILTSQ